MQLDIAWLRLKVNLSISTLFMTRISIQTIRQIGKSDKVIFFVTSERGDRGRDRMLVRSTTTYAISAYYN